MPQLKLKPRSRTSRRADKPYNKKKKDKSAAARVRAPQRNKKRTKDDRKISAAIGRNIESIMAARFVHDGGNLDILKAPKHVDGYIKGGPKHGKKQEYWKQKANVRRRKVAEQERAALLSHADMLEKKKKERMEEAKVEVEAKKKKKPTKSRTNKYGKLDEDEDDDDNDDDDSDSDSDGLVNF